MTHARKLHVNITADRTFRLPEDIPEGPAEVIVLYGGSTATQPSIPVATDRTEPQVPPGARFVSAAEVLAALGPPPLDEHGNPIVRGGLGMFEGWTTSEAIEDGLGPLPEDIQRYFDGYSDPVRPSRLRYPGRLRTTSL